MPGGYKKRGYKKRSYGRKKGGFLNRKYSAMDLASKAWSAAKYVKALVNVEHKFLDTTYTYTAQSTTPVVTWLTSISEGSDYNQRDGISVKASALYIKGTAAPNPTQTTFLQQLRCIIFQDNDNTGTAPVASDLLEASTDIHSPLNHTNGKRFRVLMDKNYLINADANGGHSIKKYFKLNDHIRWSNSTTGTREGHIYMLTMSDTATAAQEPGISWYSRLRYIDN